MSDALLNQLKVFVEGKPIVVLTFDSSEWERLRESLHGIHEFTVARGHEMCRNVRPPVPCIITREDSDDEGLYFGLINSRSPITTLDSRIKVRLAAEVEPRTKSGLLRLVNERPYANDLSRRLRARTNVSVLSPRLSTHLLDRLASLKHNRSPLRAVAESLSAAKRFDSWTALQEDAVRTALRAFGFDRDEQVRSVTLVRGRESALATINVLEDSAVEHDAREIPGYRFVQSDLTGRAIFERGGDRLEVFTANRRSLEHCFGVDLIYFNTTKQNVVMLQYKMLEPLRKDGGERDWIYRPTEQLQKEIQRMKSFGINQTPHPFEYRLNEGLFYLKFVKKDSLISAGSIITPLDHFEKLALDPQSRGPKNGLRVSYKSLDGRYLRPDVFLDLLRAGYIGARAETTNHLRALVGAVLRNDHSVVAAIQSRQTNS